MTAMRWWDDLDEPWRAAFDMAWLAFRAGGVGVGAVLTDAAGAVVGRGRNQRFDAGVLLAHAEMAALAELPARPDPQQVMALRTTLHPCPMCLGAIVVARVTHVHFGAWDPTWLGIERLPELNPEVRRRWPVRDGPLPGPLGTWAAVLPILNTRGSLLRATQAVAPQRVRLAEAVVDRLGSAADLPATCEEALERVGDLLTAGS